jgi:hypothetical protein
LKPDTKSAFLPVKLIDKRLTSVSEVEMVKIDMSLFIQIANFLFLIWAMNRVVYKPVRRMLAQRNEKISGLENTIAVSEEGVAAKDEAMRAGMKSKGKGP